MAPGVSECDRAIFRVPQELWDLIFAIIRSTSVFNNDLWTGTNSLVTAHAQGRKTLCSLRLTCHFLADVTASAAFAEVTLWTRQESLYKIVTLAKSGFGKFVRKLEFKSTNVHSGFNFVHPQTGVRIYGHRHLDEELAAKFGRMLPLALERCTNLTAIYTAYIDTDMQNLTRARMQDPMLAGLRACMEKGVLSQVRKLHLHLDFISDFASLGLAKLFSEEVVRAECSLLLGQLEELKIKISDHTHTMQSIVRGDYFDRGAWFALHHYNRSVQGLDRAFERMAAAKSVALQFQYVTALKLRDYPWENLAFLVLRTTEFEEMDMVALLDRCKLGLDTVMLESCRLTIGSWRMVFRALAACTALKECYLLSLQEPGMKLADVITDEQMVACVDMLQQSLVRNNPKNSRIELRVDAIFRRTEPFKTYQNK